MKRRIVEIIATCLIVVLALSLMKPLHAAASPGNVIISGQVTYQPRDWDPQHPNWRTGNEMTIKLYEKDLQGNNHYLDTTYTNSIGWFVFPERTNWWGPDNRQLNIYLVAVTAYSNSSVTDRLSVQYGFLSETTFLSHDGTWIKNFAVDQNWQGYQAIWIFEDLRNTWNYVHNNDFRNGVPYNPGNVKAVWELGLNCYPFQPIICNSFTYGGPSPFIFISNNDINSMDVPVHETGHMFDFVNHYTPYTEMGLKELALGVSETMFVKGIWDSINTPLHIDDFAGRKDLSFYGLGQGPKIHASQAKDLYRRFAQSPFASLYGSLSWAEDFAEVATWYFFTRHLKQPYEIRLLQDGKIVFYYEPMETKSISPRSESRIMAAAGISTIMPNSGSFFIKD